jgi:HK97 family phage portal protein
VGLGRLFRRDEVRDSSFWALPGGYGVTTSNRGYGGGSTENALRNAASWACINVLADSIGRTPIDVFRNIGTDRRPINPPPPIVAQPSGIVQTDVWRFQLGWSLATDGNAFGRITSYNRGWPTQIELLDPCCISERKVENGVASVKVDYKERHNLYPHGDIWHVPGRTVAPGSPFGLSPVDYAGQVIGTSLAAERFSFGFFDGDGHPSSIIYADDDLSQQDAQDIKDAYRRASSGREPAVFGNGLRREAIQVDPNETQFLDLIRVMVDQVCRFWGVPPSMVYGSISGQSVTYANISDYDLSFLKHSLDGYYVRLENALTDVLPRPQTARVNRNAILRADTIARYEAYRVGLANRTMTVNEVRLLEDQVPFGPEFDVPGIPPFPGMAPQPTTAPPVSNPPKEKG